MILMMPLLYYIILFSNLGDLKNQLYYFWLQIIYLLRKANYIITIIVIINILYYCM